MNKNVWFAGIIAAVVFGAGGYYFGHSSSSTTTSRAGAGTTFAGGNFAGGRAGGFAGGGAGATSGTIIAADSGSITIQLPASTSTTATTGTKIVLLDNATQVQELESVPASNLKVGQSITVSGASNSDGSVTATSIMVRPTGADRAPQTSTASQ